MTRGQCTAVATAVIVLLSAGATGAREQAGTPAAPQTASRAPGSNGGNGTTPGEARTVEPGEYLIGPEDVLEISVWRNEELSRTVPVRPDGRISLPLLHDVQAASLTAMQLRDVLTTRYTEYMREDEIEVSVIVREIHSLNISVVGEVRTPGQYQIRSLTTVLEALAMAEGFTDFAKKDQIVVFRRDGETWKRYAFNYTRMIDGTGDSNFLLQPGDIVVVP
jgi:polysaccharide export outer membrane protein